MNKRSEATLEPLRNRRSYEDGCAAAHALDLVGDRWALLVVRELLLGPRRFSDLRQALTGISPNVLSQRLTDLESVGVLERRTLQPPASCRVYALTAWGQQLETPLLELFKWGVRSPAFVRGQTLTADAMALSLKATFHPERARGLAARVTLLMDGHAYHVAVGRESVAVARGEPPCHPAEAGAWAGAVLYAEPVIVLQLAYGKRPLQEAVKANDCRLEGDPDVLERVFACFEVPAPAVTSSVPAPVAMIHPFS
ncbi:MAG TPA: winged helix-turn-helix transcriptional regulator [Burkholderiaceae bacterium]|nr:winged helix-turn-helix transcriptional regulator [Burkholderiaceae bacterium]